MVEVVVSVFEKDGEWFAWVTWGDFSHVYGPFTTFEAVDMFAHLVLLTGKEYA